MIEIDPFNGNAVYIMINRYQHNNLKIMQFIDHNNPDTRIHLHHDIFNKVIPLSFLYQPTITMIRKNSLNIDKKTFRPFFFSSTLFDFLLKNRAYFHG